MTACFSSCGEVVIYWEHIQQLLGDLVVLADPCSPVHQEDPAETRSKLTGCLCDVHHHCDALLYYWILEKCNAFYRRCKNVLYLHTNTCFSLITL